MKNLNRKAFLEFLRNETKTELIYQSVLTGNNIYFLGDKNKKVEHFQIEFISQSKTHFYTILLRGITREAEFLHHKCIKYLRDLNINRNIMLDTEYSVTYI